MSKLLKRFVPKPKPKTGPAAAPTVPPASPLGATNADTNELLGAKAHHDSIVASLTVNIAQSSSAATEQRSDAPELRDAEKSQPSNADQIVDNQIGGPVIYTEQPIFADFSIKDQIGGPVVDTIPPTINTLPIVNLKLSAFKPVSSSAFTPLPLVSESSYEESNESADVTSSHPPVVHSPPQFPKSSLLPPISSIASPRHYSDLDGDVSTLPHLPPNDLNSAVPLTELLPPHTGRERHASRLEHLPKLHKPHLPPTAELIAEPLPKFSRVCRVRNQTTAVELDTTVVDLMKVKDFLLYNPGSEPMKRTKSTKVIHEAAEEDVAVKAPKEDMSQAPQVRMNEAGEIIVDEQSLFVDLKSPVSGKHDEMEVIEEVGPRMISSNSFRKRPAIKARQWSRDETARFFKALRFAGTDFTMIQKFFPNRQQSEIRKKFNLEDKKNQSFITELLNDSYKSGDLNPLALLAPEPAEKRKQLSKNLKAVQDTAKDPSDSSGTKEYLQQRGKRGKRNRRSMVCEAEEDEPEDSSESRWVVTEDVVRQLFDPSITPAQSAALCSDLPVDAADLRNLLQVQLPPGTIVGVVLVRESENIHVYLSESTEASTSTVDVCDSINETTLQISFEPTL